MCILIHLLNKIQEFYQCQVIKSCTPFLELLHAPPLLYAPKIEKRLNGKQPALEADHSQKERRMAKSHKSQVQGVQWTADESAILANAPRWREGQKLETIILHNRNAESQHAHVLPLEQSNGICTCKNCLKTSNFLARF